MAYPIPEIEILQEDREKAYVKIYIPNKGRSNIKDYPILIPTHLNKHKTPKRLSIVTIDSFLVHCNVLFQWEGNPNQGIVCLSEGFAHFNIQHSGGLYKEKIIIIQEQYYYPQQVLTF